MPDSDDPVLLLTTWSDSEAELVREILASYGIQCSVSSQVPHSVLPLTVDGLGEIRVHVPAAALDEARRILSAHRSGSGKAGGGGEVIPMSVTVKAATRIDLAGGTLDIWPLYLFLESPVTVNLAINLHAAAEATALPGGRVSLSSDDRDTSVDAASVEELDAGGVLLPLPARLVRHYAPRGGVRLRTAASVPAGSGLGGSSALAVAMALALQRLAGGGRRATETPVAGAHRLARLLSNLEAQVLGIPTGVQDYYPALLGGALSLTFTVDGVITRRLNVDGSLLAERLVLVYEGASRASGISNLDMVQRFLAGDRATREGLQAVGRAAAAMTTCLEAGDLDGAGEAMEAEMAARRGLSPKVMTSGTERLFAAARGEKALAAKVCGAGGGGCSVYWARPGREEALAASLEKAGGRVLPFAVDNEGLLREPASGV